MDSGKSDFKMELFMKKNTHLHCLAYCMCSLLITACGGGSGGNGYSSGNNDQLIEDVAPPVTDDGNDQPEEVYQPLTFSNFQPADLIVETDASGDPLFVVAYTSPFVATDGSLWVADTVNNFLAVFGEIPETDGVTPDYIESIQYPDGMGGMEDYALNGAISPTVHNNRMLVPLYDDNTVVIFDRIPVAGENNTGIILGSAGFDSEPVADCSSAGMSGPENAVATDGKMIVADAGNNRVLIWNAVPSVSGTEPDLVLGQNSFDTCETNDDDQDGNSDNASARTFSSPAGIWSNGEKLAVIDGGNHRVLLWNTFPTENFTAADVVLGQQDFVSYYRNDADNDSSQDDPSAQTMNLPYQGVFSDGEQLFIADGDNNRVLIWNSWPTENGQAADVVLGQNSFTNITRNDDNQDGITDTSTNRTMNTPNGLVVFVDRLIVMDSQNRLMFFSGE